MPLGKAPLIGVNLEASYLGYEPRLLSALQVNSGKELVLNIELVESTIAMEEVGGAAKHDKTKPLNEMATGSARSFSVEETGRYAASMYDPARMAHTAQIDIQDLTNRLHAYTLYYSPTTDQVEAYTQVGLFPNLNYRI